MAPPPPMPNGNLSNGIAKPAHIITPQNNNNSHAGLLKQIESGELKEGAGKVSQSNKIVPFRSRFT